MVFEFQGDQARQNFKMGDFLLRKPFGLGVDDAQGADVVAG